MVCTIATKYYSGINALFSFASFFPNQFNQKTVSGEISGVPIVVSAAGKGMISSVFNDDIPPDAGKDHRLYKNAGLSHCVAKVQL